MAKPRVGIGFEGVLFPGRFRATDRRDLDTALGDGAISGAIGGLLRLLPQADVAIYPLWPALGRAAFIARWLNRLAEHPDILQHPDDADALSQAMRMLEISDRRPDDLDAWVGARS